MGAYVLILGSFLTPNDSLAQTRTWVASSPGNYFAHSNWSDGRIPNGIDHTAIITANPTAEGNFVGFGSLTLGSLIFDNPLGRNLNLIGQSTLTFQVSSGNALFSQMLGDGATIFDIDELNLALSNVVLASTTEFRFSRAEVSHGVAIPIISPQISGANRLIASGNFGFILANNNNSFSALTVSDAFVYGSSINNFGANSAFGVGNFELSNRGRLTFYDPKGTGSASTNRTVLLGSGGGEIDWRNDGALTWKGLISGSGDLRLSGNIQLDAANTYGGDTSIDGGTVRIGNFERIPNGSAVGIGDDGILDIDDFNETIASLIGRGRVELGDAGSLTVGSDNPPIPGAFSGVINGGGFSLLEKTGSNYLRLEGVNTFYGFRISGGTVEGNSIANSGIPSAFGSGNVIRISNNGRLHYSGYTSASTNRPIVLSDGGGRISLYEEGGKTLTWNGVISGSGSLEKQRSGTLVLGASNTYSGETIVSEGTLRLSASDRIPDGSTVRIAGYYSRFDLNGFSETTGALAGDGLVELGAAGRLITGGNNSSTTYTGRIRGGSTSRLEKKGTGSLTLSGYNERNVGTLAVSNGVLRLTQAEIKAASVSVNSETPAGVPTLHLNLGAAVSQAHGVVIGDSRNGYLIVEDGSELTNGAEAVIGQSAGSNGTARIQGWGAKWSNSGALFVANDGVGKMYVYSGAEVRSAGGQVGASAGSTGSVVVDSTGSLWSTGGNSLRVGNSGNASVLITDGGSVTSSTGFVAYAASSTANVTIARLGASWSTSGSMYVGGSSIGPGGAGTVMVEEGGELAVALRLRIWQTGSLNVNGGNVNVRELDRRGTLNHNDGTITVDGGPYTHSTTGDTLVLNGSTPDALPRLILANGATTSGITGLRLGDSRKGHLAVEQGSQLVNTDEAFLGHVAGSTGTAVVSGADSSWDYGDQLDVGRGGAGELTISGGGNVHGRSSIVGQFRDSHGTATVIGSGSTWANDGSLTVGRSGNGTLSIADGASVFSYNGLVAQFAGSSGLVTVSGSESIWSVAEQLAIGGNGSTGVDGGTGTVVISDGGTISVTERIVLLSAGTLALDGGNVNVGEFDLRGTLKINLSSALGFEGLTVAGQATLAGSVEVTLDEAFSPLAGDSFEILSAGDIVGDFSSYMLPELPGALTWESLVTGNSVTLSVATPLAADFNGDGFVDARDLADWKGAFGPSDAADADADGDSDGVDFLQWQRQLGTGVGAVPTGGVVPEPSAFILAGVSLACVAMRRRRLM